MSNTSKIQLAIIAGLCGILSLSIGWYEHWTIATLEQRTDQYGRYLEIPLWDLDEEAATQYLQVIGQSGAYRSIAVYHADGSPFVASDAAYDPGPLDRLCHSAYLIRDRTITQTIRRDGRHLGRIEAVWVNDNIYTHISAALFLTLLGKVLHYYIRLRANSQALERNNLALLQSQHKLRESEDYLQRITESLGEGLLIIDLDEVALYANSRLTELTGYTMEDLLGQPAYQLLLPPAERERMRDRTRERTCGHSEQYELQLQCKDGSLFWAHVHTTPFRNRAGEIVATLGAVTDISERKHLEDQLHHAQKMDAIGELTAGIAHNFNNMLLGVMGNIEFSIEDGPDNIKPFLDESYRVCEQAAEMIAQLMAFSHRGVHTAHARLDPATLIARTVSICTTTFDRKIAIKSAVAGHLPLVSGDAGQLEQALLNLMINARDAVAEVEGRVPTIQLSAEVVTLDVPTQSPDARTGTFVRLQIEDNGVGMDAETREKAFDPFYTTKPVGQGTGLGLSTVYGTAHLHGGWLECQSALGQGATFALYLPPAAPAPVEEETEPAAEATGSETVLVIDDEEAVRRVLDAS